MQTIIQARFFLPLLLLPFFFSGCASQAPQVKEKESGYSLDQQRQAQASIKAQTPKKLALKRKIALGRVSNETLHGKSLLRDSHDDTLGKQVTDMLSKALTESGNFLVFERPDIGRIQDEAALTGRELNLVGSDALVIGSLTEFGRRTTGESGFFSSSKKQTAYAKVDMRLVDTTTGQITEAFSGAGEASIENVNVAGFGSKAAYDAAINDRAISIAIADAVNTLTQLLTKQPWQSSILSIDNEGVYMSGGASQGVATGMEFDVLVKGKRVKSGQSGFLIQLPGKKIARVKVTSLFGKSDTDEGAVVTLVNGSLGNYQPDQLLVQEVTP
ncbi:CsgG/HfaB family protein [Teredinibacter haidensis]|mgnify:CR=1 FL=1|uniref:CsgG/HfaB family protein n=1 Tax=Teredinibacter haidensis TaxID=2731755 RepID=UPI0009491744|nr:CsgG/HfaB family protein [Teredinibacter haidensis]